MLRSENYRCSNNGVANYACWAVEERVGRHARDLLARGESRLGGLLLPFTRLRLSYTPAVQLKRANGTGQAGDRPAAGPAYTVGAPPQWPHALMGRPPCAAAAPFTRRPQCDDPETKPHAREGGRRTETTTKNVPSPPALHLFFFYSLQSASRACWRPRLPFETACFHPD